VGTMENDLADRDVAMRSLGDSASAPPDRGVKLDSVEEDFFKPSGGLSSKAISRTRCSRAVHDLFIQNANFVHGLRRTIRCRVRFELGRYL
jgi:hypothetical protein